MNKHLYLLQVENDVEPKVIGPFDDEAARDAAAKHLREVYQFEGGIFPLDIESATPPKSVKAWAYSGGFFQGDDEFEEGGQEEGPEPSVLIVPANPSSCFNLNPQQIAKVEKVMLRTGGNGAPAILEMPEGPDTTINACRILSNDLRLIGFISARDAFRI